MSSDLLRCPYCGKVLNPNPKYDTKFHKWGTISFTTVLSFMLLAFDLVNDGAFENWSVDWSQYAILGLWIFYISTQLLRANPSYGWMMLPVSGILFSFFFYYIDHQVGENSSFLGTDWAWNVIIPIVTFVVIIPILGRVARKSPSHYAQLEYLVETLEAEVNMNEDSTN